MIGRVAYVFVRAIGRANARLSAASRFLSVSNKGLNFAFPFPFCGEPSLGAASAGGVLCTSSALLHAVQSQEGIASWFR